MNGIIFGIDLDLFEDDSVSPEEQVIKMDLFNKLSDVAKEAIIAVLDTPWTLNGCGKYLRKRLNELKYTLKIGKQFPKEGTKLYNLWWGLSNRERREYITIWEEEGVFIPKHMKVRRNIRPDSDVDIRMDVRNGLNLRYYLQHKLDISRSDAIKVVDEVSKFVDQI